jgi:hypothetical protein
MPHFTITGTEKNPIDVKKYKYVEEIQLLQRELYSRFLVTGLYEAKIKLFSVQFDV